MCAGKKSPPLLMLEAKGIHMRDAFRFTDAAGGYYLITRGGQMTDLSGEMVVLSEDEIWERFDAVERISHTAFEEAQQAYRDAIWRARGQPDTQTLESYGVIFLREYKTNYAAARWKCFCRYDEETLRRLVERVVDAFFPMPPDAKTRQKKWQQIYLDLVMAKAALSVVGFGDDSSEEASV